MQSEVLDLVLRWLVPFLCGGAMSLISMAVASARQNHKKENAFKKGVQCLLRAEIIRSYDKYTERGFCPLYAKEALTRAYDSYHELGGNDVATDLYHQMMQMPGEPKED